MNVDKDRRDILKILIGTSVSLGLGGITVPLVGALIGGKANLVKPSPYGHIEVMLCEDPPRCPDDFSVTVSEIRNASAEGRPLFRLIKKGTMAIPTVFGIVKIDQREYPVAYNIVCTHFGCPVNQSGPADNMVGFFCPCHGSSFSIDRDPASPTFLAALRIAGPAPRPLRPVKVVAARGGELLEPGAPLLDGDVIYAVKAYV